LFDQLPYSPDHDPSDYNLLTWRTDCDHSPSTLIKCWKVTRRGWAYSWQTSLTQAHKTWFPDISTSIPAMAMLGRCLSVHVFYVYNRTFYHSLFFNSSPEVTLSYYPTNKISRGKWRVEYIDIRHSTVHSRTHSISLYQQERIASSKHRVDVFWLHRRLYMPI
jgi:hypothetical protein